MRPVREESFAVRLTALLKRRTKRRVWLQEVAGRRNASPFGRERDAVGSDLELNIYAGDARI